MLKKIPKNVFILGWVSFFNDVAAEMIYPILPIFLTAVLKAPVTIVGVIEGIAEATASLGKFIFGYLSDKVGKRKPFVVAGYSLATMAKVLIALANSWPWVLLARFIDRTGKGLRTGARDALLLQSADQNNRGFIFGFHRALDSAGAMTGPLLALILLYFLKDNLRLIFYLAAIPGIIGVFLLIFFVNEKYQIKRLSINNENKKTPIKITWKNFHPQLKLFFFSSLIFSLGNSSDAFLILRAKDLGLATSLTVLTYVLYNFFQSIFATPLGKLADKIGPYKVFKAGLLVFSAVYFFFGFIKDAFWIWFLFPIYGLYIAATDGVSKAYLSQFITQKESGSYFGLYQMIIAVSSFFASWFAGILWHRINPSITFYYGSLMALLAFLILIIFNKKDKKLNI